jgi:hypothetical protein
MINNNYIKIDSVAGEGEMAPALLFLVTKERQLQCATQRPLNREEIFDSKK